MHSHTHEGAIRSEPRTKARFTHHAYAKAKQLQQETGQSGTESATSLALGLLQEVCVTAALALVAKMAACGDTPSLRSNQALKCVSDQALKYVSWTGVWPPMLVVYVEGLNVL